LKRQLHNPILAALGKNVAILDQDGVIIDVNQPWIQFATENGASAREAIGINYLDVCRRAVPSCPDAQTVLDGMLAVGRGEIPRFQHSYRCDSPTEPRWFTMTAVPLSPGRGLIVAHQNNTETHQAAESFSRLLHSVRAIIWRAEVPGFRTTFASQQTAEILGFPAEAWSREPDLWQRQIHPDDREWVTAFSAKAIHECRNHAFEYRMLTADGRTVWLRNLVNVTVQNGVATELLGVSVDITDRKRAEEARDGFARALSDAQDNERAFIARELHDDLGQSLAMLALKLSALGQRLHDAPERRQEIGTVTGLADKIAADLRRISHGLHPSSLDLLGLGPAIRQLCAEFSDQPSTAVTHEIHNIPLDLDGAVAICLYRVAQECLRNVLKHSHAAHARVQLSCAGAEIRLQIADDGTGFDPAAARRTGGLGLASMAERLRLVGGKLAIASAPGNGTQVDATIPRPTSQKSTPM
jgi:PAS domain S-box-containing protein